MLAATRVRKRGAAGLYSRPTRVVYTFLSMQIPRGFVPAFFCNFFFQLMKTSTTAVFLLFTAITVHAQMAATIPQDAPWSVVARGPHNNVWQRTDYEVTSTGEVRTNLH